MSKNDTNTQPETDNTPARVERKDWNFGHFGTRHDGEKWSLVRIKSAFGFTLCGDDQEVVATNKSATPLVALARKMSRVEKRDIRIRKLREQLTLLACELNELTDQRDQEREAVAAESAPLTGKALKARAAELEIKGRGKMTADQLREAVDAAEAGA